MIKAYPASTTLPAQSGDRILVLQEPDEDILGEMDEEEETSFGPSLHIVDFDQGRLQAWLNLNEEQRISTSQDLLSSSPSTGVQMKVVTRQYVFLSDGQLQSALSGSTDNLGRELAADSPLLYDEEEVVPNTPIRSGYVQAKLHLGQSKSDFENMATNLALTTSGVVEVPVPGRNGLMHYFSEEIASDVKGTESR